MQPLSSTSRFPFYIFGFLAEAEYLPQNATVAFRLPQWQEDNQTAIADFIQHFGACMIDPDYPESGTIGERLSRIHAISNDLHDLYTMGDDHQRPAFQMLAEWNENNSRHVRIQDAFGGSFTYRFDQDGRVSRSYKQEWELVADVAPMVAANA